MKNEQGIYVCPACGCVDCMPLGNSGMYTCGSRGSYEWNSFVQSETCKKLAAKKSPAAAVKE